MSSNYRINNLLIKINSLSLQINISFYLDEQQHIDLTRLISGIKSIKFDDHSLPNKHCHILLEYISSFSKLLATDIHVSISNQEALTSYSFCGGLLNNQMIELTTDVTQFVLPHSVLIFAFDSRLSPRLLLVKHRTRGWELPGGKLEMNEKEIDAVLRETREEGAVELISHSIKPIAQYQFFHDNEGKVHIRTMFLGMIHSILDADLNLDTIERQIVVAPEWNDAEIFNPNNHYSPYLKDNVYPICLKLALTQLTNDKN